VGLEQPRIEQGENQQRGTALQNASKLASWLLQARSAMLPTKPAKAGFAAPLDTVYGPSVGDPSGMELSIWHQCKANRKHTTA
jgi:hypothetical protein